jgi:hypothetical protein
VEESLRARLLANVALAALVGTRVSWIERPQGAALPAVTLQIISPGRAYTHGGANNLADTRVQIDCWGASYASAKAVARAVIPATESAGTQGATKFSQSFLDASRDMPVEDLEGGMKVYRVSHDFIIWHEPA